MNRINQLADHLIPSSKNNVTAKHQDDVVIVAAYRTALTRGGKGGFKDVNSDYILAEFLKKLIAKTNIDPSIIEDVIVGNVLNPGAGATEHRAAMLAAGIPSKVPFMSLNRQCSSGLMAVNDISNKIKTGEIDCGLACGVESMSQNYGPKSIPVFTDALKKNPEAQKCTIPMGITNENVASSFSIPRAKQDDFAAKSYQKAEAAIAGGLFKDEILPVETLLIDDEDDNDDEDSENYDKNSSNETKYKSKTIDTDEGPRKNVTAQSLGKIRPAFKKDGVTTAGNASQVSDGAAGVLLMRRSFAESKNYPIIGKFVACSSVGVPPEIMGVGPAYAIPHLLNKLKLSIDDVSVFEINEAFAAQCLYCAEKLNIPFEKLNPRGGAIALGHPLGCTGARQIATILRELKTGEIGLTSMCIGTGMGAASVLVKE